MSDTQQPANLAGERCIAEGYAVRWSLRPDDFGLLEIGDGMPVEAVLALAQAGKEKLLDYAKGSFTLAEQSIYSLTQAQHQAPRPSILPNIGLSPSGVPNFYG